MHTRTFAGFIACLAALAALDIASAARAGGLAVITAFAGPNGADPHASLTLDSQENLFGTTQDGGSVGKGTVFEIVHGTHTVITLASFTGTGKNGDTNGASPYAGVTLDSQGNLFGTTEYGGPSGDGTVWEIVHGTTTLTTIASFSGTDGDLPIGGVTLDSSGNLYGTTLEGGTASAGNVWKIVHGTNAIISLASFTEVNPIGGLPWAGVTIDGQGNLLGTTEVGGAGGAGTVWEIAAGTTAITILASFSGAGPNGTGTGPANPLSQLVLDSSGNLYGTTNSGGTGSEGTVFEVVHDSGTITVLGQFSGTNGGGPGNMLTLDSGGNLYGTAYSGGANNAGTVWEIPHGGTLTTLVTFPGGASGQAPIGAVTLDRYGDLLGTMSGSSNYGYGDGGVWEISPSGHTHLLWNKTDGTASLWTVNPDTSFASIAYGPFTGWTAHAVADAPDGSSWLLWTNTNGQISLWHVTSLTANGYTSTQYGPYAGYTAVSLSVGSDGDPSLLWDKTGGTAALWTVSHTSGAFASTAYGPYSGWTANAVASGATVTDLLWTNVNGQAAGWRLNSGGIVSKTFGPYASYGSKALSVGPDDGAHLLWDSTNGTAALWSVDFSSGAFTSTSYGPFSGWTAKAIATGPDNVTHILWNHAPDGQASLWSVTGGGYTSTQYGPYSGWTAVAGSAGP